LHLAGEHEVVRAINLNSGVMGDARELPVGWEQDHLELMAAADGLVAPRESVAVTFDTHALNQAVLGQLRAMSIPMSPTEWLQRFMVIARHGLRASRIHSHALANGLSADTLKKAAEASWELEWATAEMEILRANQPQHRGDVFLDGRSLTVVQALSAVQRGKRLDPPDDLEFGDGAELLNAAFCARLQGRAVRTHLGKVSSFRSGLSTLTDGSRRPFYFSEFFMLDKFYRDSVIANERVVMERPRSATTAMRALLMSDWSRLPPSWIDLNERAHDEVGFGLDTLLRFLGDCFSWFDEADTRMYCWLLSPRAEIAQAFLASERDDGRSIGIAEVARLVSAMTAPQRPRLEKWDVCDFDMSTPSRYVSIAGVPPIGDYAMWRIDPGHVILSDMGCYTARQAVERFLVDGRNAPHLLSALDPHASRLSRTNDKAVESDLMGTLKMSQAIYFAMNVNEQALASERFGRLKVGSFEADAIVAVPKYRCVWVIDAKRFRSAHDEVRLVTNQVQKVFGESRKSLSAHLWHRVRTVQQHLARFLTALGLEGRSVEGWRVRPLFVTPAYAAPAYWRLGDIPFTLVADVLDALHSDGSKGMYGLFSLAKEPEQGPLPTRPDFHLIP
jgi:hypothetical protein